VTRVIKPYGAGAVTLITASMPRYLAVLQASSAHRVQIIEGESRHPDYHLEATLQPGGDIKAVAWFSMSFSRPILTLASDSTITIYYQPKTEAMHMHQAPWEKLRVVTSNIPIKCMGWTKSFYQMSKGGCLQVCDGCTVELLNPWEGPDGDEALMMIFQSTTPMPQYHPRILEERILHNRTVSL